MAFERGEAVAGGSVLVIAAGGSGAEALRGLGHEEAVDQVDEGLWVLYRGRVRVRV